MQSYKFHFTTELRSEVQWSCTLDDGIFEPSLQIASESAMVSEEKQVIFNAGNKSYDTTFLCKQCKILIDNVLSVKVNSKKCTVC